MPNSADFNHFSTNPVDIDISRSIFNMDHSIKFSCNCGDVIPFEVLEVVPGDTFEIDTTKVVRLQPLVTPIMDEVIMDTYWFFVPNRLVWNHWKEFMGENNQSAWSPTVEYNIPTITIPTGGFNIGTIADYMGVPAGDQYTAGCKISALPFRAYALICDQWFRSEAVMDPVHVHVDDSNRTGVNTGDQVTDIELGGKPFIACKFFDYFTSALPDPQRGDPVTLPIFDFDSSGSKYFPVRNIDSVGISNIPNHPYNHTYGINTTDPGVTITYKSSTASGRTNKMSSVNYLVNNTAETHSTDQNVTMMSTTSSPSNYQMYFSNLYTVMNRNQFESININDLRTAFAIQRYLERSGRYGGRYIEHIKAFFNVDSPDARLQRSEYLGGSRLSLNINSVEATSSQGQPLGTVAGMSVSADENSDFTKSFTEDGLIIGCAVLRYHHTYQQGLDRMWFRKTKFDFYNPVFANLGEQAIDEVELRLRPSATVGMPDSGSSQTFGYQERWAEYRYRPNRVAGEFRSDASNSLDMWHLADDYNSDPSLSPTWLREDKTNLDRCLAVTSAVSNQCLCDFYLKIKASRPMPLYSIPGLIDHH